MKLKSLRAAAAAGAGWPAARTVIREALRQLETEGLIANVPDKGPVVRALSLVEAGDLCTIRAVLEGLAARLFVQHAGDDDMGRLAQALDVVVGAYERGRCAGSAGNQKPFLRHAVRRCGQQNAVTHARHAARAHLALACAILILSGIPLMLK